MKSRDVLQIAKDQVVKSANTNCIVGRISSIRVKEALPVLFRFFCLKV